MTSKCIFKGVPAPFSAPGIYYFIAHVGLGKLQVSKHVVFTYFICFKNHEYILDIPKSMWRLASNSVYIVTCLGACMELIIVSGFVVFLPKYLETQFSLGKSQASVFTGKSFTVSSYSYIHDANSWVWKVVLSFSIFDIV